MNSEEFKDIVSAKEAYRIAYEYYKRTIDGDMELAFLSELDILYAVAFAKKNIVSMDGGNGIVYYIPKDGRKPYEGTIASEIRHWANDEIDLTKDFIDCD